MSITSFAHQGLKGRHHLSIFEVLASTWRGAFTPIKLLRGWRCGYHFCRQTATDKGQWYEGPFFNNTDMLVMFIAAAGLALVSLCYYLLLPPCVAASAISSTRSSSIQRYGVKHTQFYSARGKESLWQSCFTSHIQFANKKTPWTQLSIDNFLTSNNMGTGEKGLYLL